jgi:solute carrier family 25 (peroxisomal adenine nucleotide transporter), member 17
MPTPSSSSPSPLAHAISGSLGSALALWILYPLERIRTELQTLSKPTNENSTIQSSRPFTSNKSHSSENTKEHENEEDSSPKSSISQSSTSSWLDCITSDNDSIESQITSQNVTTVHSTSSESIITCWIRLKNKGQLYQGLAPVVSTVAASNFIFFWVHQILKRWLQTRIKQSLRHDLLASTLAGIINVILTNPLWVANLRIVQGRTTANSTTLFHQLYTIYQTEGLSSLWSGTSSSLLLVSNPVLQFVCYEQLKQNVLYRMKRRIPTRQQQQQQQSPYSISPTQAFLLGAFSKAIATIVTYPLQLTQVLLRLDNAVSSNDSSHVRYGGTIHCLQLVWQEQGWKGLFQGLDAKILQTCFTAALTFVTYEQLLRLVRMFLESNTELQMTA